MYEIKVTELNIVNNEYQLSCELYGSDGLIKDRVLTMTYNQFENGRDDRVASWAMTYLEREGLHEFDGIDSSSKAIAEGVIEVSESFTQT